MSRPVPDSEYHRIACASLDEATAFVAALTRYLDSPGSDALRRRERPIEVWAELSREGRGADLYLSDGALEAAATAFSLVPVARKGSGADIQGKCFLVVGAPAPPVQGIEEARRRLQTRKS